MSIKRPTYICAHCGIVKLNTADVLLPLLVTLAAVQGFQVQVVPIAIVPLGHCPQVSPLSPFGIQKFNTASLLLPLLLTPAQHPAGRVTVLPTLTVAAFQSSPLTHFGIVKSNTALWQSQLLITQAQVQASQVQVSPTFTVAASPVSPLGHLILLPSGFNITIQYLVGSSVLLTTLNLLVASLS